MVQGKGQFAEFRYRNDGAEAKLHTSDEADPAAQISFSTQLVQFMVKLPFSEQVWWS